MFYSTCSSPVSDTYREKANAKKSELAVCVTKKCDSSCRWSRNWDLQICGFIAWYKAKGLIFKSMLKWQRIFVSFYNEGKYYKSENRK